MADLGTLTCTVPRFKLQSLDVALAWNITNNPITCYGGITNNGPKKEDWKEFSGQVLNSLGAGIAREVVALDRATLKVMARTMSDGAGYFLMLVPYDVDHIVFRLDSSDNLVAFDRVNPV